MIGFGGEHGDVGLGAPDRFIEYVVGPRHLGASRLLGALLPAQGDQRA